jgi:hypothetical protein
MNYPGKGHPWSDFLHHRLRAIKWSQSECGDSVERLVSTFSCDETQMRLLLSTPLDADGEERNLCPLCGTIAVLDASHARECVSQQLANAARRGESCPWCRGRLTSDERFNMGPPVFDHHHSCPRSRE